jgi:hypothetical protein
LRKKQQKKKTSSQSDHRQHGFSPAQRRNYCLLEKKQQKKITSSQSDHRQHGFSPAQRRKYCLLEKKQQKKKTSSQKTTEENIFTERPPPKHHVDKNTTPSPAHNRAKVIGRDARCHLQEGNDICCATDTIP